ncbi:N-acetyltransferase [Ornithinimicrobium avium]|uniref:N-acetyltransferase n=1 Tax=Ornithinimicrobium avium TaxID=2283195 RepID=A0A345NID5_9MICO|nr:N-acetyltransferase [Ornithinimicrobium avium]AXH94793.1 N-acetyltransferase [Ornithinimicrobium avium]
MTSTITVTRGNDPGAVRRILASLPDWFGIPEANEHYVRAGARLPGYLASVDDRVVGVALVDALEEDLRADGAQVLQVKTVGASFEDEGYAATRAFYEARGFLPLQEVDGLDWDGPTLVMVKPLRP